MKWYDGENWHQGPVPAGAKGQVNGRDFRVLVGSGDQRGLSFDEIKELPGHWRTTGSHREAKRIVEEEVDYVLHPEKYI